MEECDEVIKWSVEVLCRSGVGCVVGWRKEMFSVVQSVVGWGCVCVASC